MKKLLNQVATLEALGLKMVEEAQKIRHQLEQEGTKKKKPVFDTTEYLAKRRKQLIKTP